MKKELLMTYDGYVTRKHPIPYSYRLEKNGQHLFYFGAKHSFDPHDPQFHAIEDFWNEFVEKTKGMDQLVLVEGGNRPALPTKEQAILEGGEMHFAAHLAKLQQIPTFSPEPPARYRLETLVNQFSKEEIIYHDFARLCYQWNSMKEKPEFEEYAGRYLRAALRESEWTDFEFTISNLTLIHRKIFGMAFEKTDTKFFRGIVDPTTEKSVINRLARWEEHCVRDPYIVGEIERFWNEGKNLFIIYGASHAVMQEEMVRDVVSGEK
jgi:hypothetical protein